MMDLQSPGHFTKQWCKLPAVHIMGGWCATCGFYVLCFHFCVLCFIAFNNILDQEAFT